MNTEKIGVSAIPELVAFWNRNMEEAYRISDKMALEKIVNDKDLFAEGTFILREGNEIKALIVTKISDNSLPEYQNTAWLSVLIVDSAARRSGLGSMLYKKAEHALKSTGIKKLLMAGEMNNFFSGIPAPDTASTAFFKKMGFTLNTENHFDLVNDVSKVNFDDFDVPCYTKDDYCTRPVTKADFAALEQFLKDVFPGRWDQEVMGYLNDGGNPDFVLGLFHGSTVKGFCRVSVHSEPSDYNMYFGENWGSLGPIGIAADIRGCGLGNRILGDALRYLKKIGAHNVNIDWTVLRKYYGQFGFEPWRTYLSAYKEI